MSNYESSTIVLTLPLPPSVNDYYGHFCQGQRAVMFIKQKGKEYRLKVKEYIELNHLNIQANIPIKVEIIINYEKNVKQDLDNRMKCLLDALTHAGVWVDDFLIEDLHVMKGIVSKPGGAIVKIQEHIDENE